MHTLFWSRFPGLCCFSFRCISYSPAFSLVQTKCKRGWKAPKSNAKNHSHLYVALFILLGLGCPRPYLTFLDFNHRLGGAQGWWLKADRPVPGIPTYFGPPKADQPLCLVGKLSMSWTTRSGVPPNILQKRSSTHKISLPPPGKGWKW